MTNRQITLAKCDDWEGLYIDGEMKYQNHKVRISDFCEALGIELKEVWADCEAAYEMGSFPDNLEELVIDDN